MKFHRHASVVPSERARGAAGSTIALRTDEVSRHAVRLVAIGREADTVELTRFAALPSLLREGDIVVVNDAATLPGSLRGVTTGGELFELRLSGPPEMEPGGLRPTGGVDGSRLAGVLLGAGDHHTRTEHRAAPPVLAANDRVRIAGLDATVASAAGRRVELVVRAEPDALWQALYAHGRAVQYAHRPELLPLYAVQTAYAARPWAAEMPSAGRPLTWDVLLGLRRRGIAIAQLTHAAGLSSTGDDALDHALPWPERYEIPRRTLDAIEHTHASGGRVVAVGTTVVRALESAAQSGASTFALAGRSPTRSISGLLAGRSPTRSILGIARLRLDPTYRPRVVDGLISGLHTPGESHFELLQAFAPRDRLVRAIELAASHGLSGHELGDACLIL